MKRYWLFAYDIYAARGGMCDCCGEFDTMEEAQKSAETEKLTHRDCCEVWDMQRGVQVADYCYDGWEY